MPAVGARGFMVPTRATSFPLVLVLVLMAGCAAETRTEVRTETVFETVTVTYTPPAPPTFLQVATIDNQAGKSYEVRFQPYTFNSQGDRTTSGYAIKSVRANAGTTTVGTESYPKCDDRMEGLNVELYPIGSTAKEPLQDVRWPGVHCTGASKSYKLTIKADTSMTFG